MRVGGGCSLESGVPLLIPHCQNLSILGFRSGRLVFVADQGAWFLGKGKDEMIIRQGQ